MSQEFKLGKLSNAELKFLEDNELKKEWFFSADEYYTNCPHCDFHLVHVYPRPTIKDSKESKFDRLYCYCNKCQLTGPLHTIRKDKTYTPPEGIKRFIYGCQYHYNKYVANIAPEARSTIKDYPTLELFNKIGVGNYEGACLEDIEKATLKEFKGFLGYTTREAIQDFNNDRCLIVTQKLPYKIPKETPGFIFPFGPQPGYHVGFVIIYENCEDIEVYTVRDTIYKANGRDNYIFYNCVINSESDDFDNIKEAGEYFLDRKDEDGKEGGISILLTSYLAPIDPMKHELKVVKDRFGDDAFERSNLKKPAKKATTKNKKPSKSTAKVKPKSKNHKD